MIELMSYSGRLGGPPTAVEAVGLWVAVILGSLLLRGLFKSYWPKTYARLRHTRLPIAKHLWWTKPAMLVDRLVPDRADPYVRYVTDVRQLDDLARSWGIVGMLSIDSASEEFLFRGVPLVVAVMVGFSPLLSVALGTLLWALLHELSELPRTLLMGAFLAWLWLTGAWVLAVGIHVVHNLIGHFARREYVWRKHGRYPVVEEAT